MMRTHGANRHGWMTFKDKSNALAIKRATAARGAPVELCTEFSRSPAASEKRGMQLGLDNLARHVRGADFDFEKLAHTVEIAVRQLDRVIDLNFYPLAAAGHRTCRWRPVGFGLMGLAGCVLQVARLPFAARTRERCRGAFPRPCIFTRCAPPRPGPREGAHPAFADTRAAAAELQFDSWASLRNIPIAGRP